MARLTSSTPWSYNFGPDDRNLGVQFGTGFKPSRYFVEYGLAATDTTWAGATESTPLVKVRGPGDSLVLAPEDSQSKLLPAGELTLIRLKRKSVFAAALAPRVDLAIGEEDMQVTGGDVTITVHNLGGADYQGNDGALILLTREGDDGPPITRAIDLDIPGPSVALEPSSKSFAVTGLAAGTWTAHIRRVPTPGEAMISNNDANFVIE